MRLICGRGAGGVLIILLFQMRAWAQASSAPTRTLCRQWDDAYLSVFETSFWVCAASILVLALLAGLLGRWIWLGAAARSRIAVVAILIFFLVELGIVALPWMVGFGWLWFAAIDTAYFQCIPMKFGAQGFFGGVIGAELAAIGQWPTMACLLLISAGAAGLLVWLLSELIARFGGLRRRARREGI